MGVVTSILYVVTGSKYMLIEEPGRNFHNGYSFLALLLYNRSVRGEKEIPMMEDHHILVHASQEAQQATEGPPNETPTL